MHKAARLPASRVAPEGVRKQRWSEIRANRKFESHSGLYGFEQLDPVTERIVNIYPADAWQIHIAPPWDSIAREMRDGIRK